MRRFFIRYQNEQVCFSGGSIGTQRAVIGWRGANSMACGDENKVQIADMKKHKLRRWHMHEELNVRRKSSLVSSDGLLNVQPYFIYIAYVD